MRPIDALKHVVATLAMYLVVLPFVLPLTAVEDAPVDATTWLLVVLSAIANVMVLSYHHVVPAHPKFSLIPWRRRVLLAHIISGTTEFLAGVYACAVGGHELAGQIMAVTALLVHVPSALLQTPTVFGSRAIMRPSYRLCIGLHAFCAAMLLTYPTSTYWTVATFLLFNTYVWVRVHFYLLDKFGFFAGAKYTVAVLLAGLTTTPFVLGPAAMFIIALGWTAFIAAYTFFFVSSRAEFHDFIRERARDSAYSESALSLWQRGGDPDLAREFFEIIDANGDGHIEPDELEEVLLAGGLPTRAVRHYMESHRAGGTLPFEDFLTHLWPIPELRRVADEVVFTRAGERSDMDKAQFVFRRLDIDGNGTLTVPELENLLAEWSMPAREVRSWLETIDVSTDTGVSFEVFYERMRPIWRFVYYDILEARFGSRSDLIQRVFDAWEDDAETRKLADDIRSELVRSIPFLQAAGDDFIEELAACLVEEEYQAGDVLFEEGDPGEDFWVVRAGRVRVSRGGEHLADLLEGDWLGEGALLARRPRSASARIVSSTLLYRASAASFAYLLERHPDMREAIDSLHDERRLDRAMTELRRDLLTRVPFLRAVEEPVLRQLASRLERVEAEGVVTKEGNPVDALYLLSTGRVRLERSGRALSELGPGSFFGDATDSNPNPSYATVIADQGTVLCRLDRGDLAWLVRQQGAEAGTA